TQPTLTHVPPRRRLSTTATRAPCCAARRAVAKPPLPPPSTNRSYVFMVIRYCRERGARLLAHHHDSRSDCSGKRRVGGIQGRAGRGPPCPDHWSHLTYPAATGRASLPTRPSGSVNAGVFARTPKPRAHAAYAERDPLVWDPGTTLRF